MTSPTRAQGRLGGHTLGRLGLAVREGAGAPRAIVITVGDELLLGRTVDGNAAWLGRALSDLGEPCANCFAGSGTKWKTRMFSPSLGVAEDPATGSAAGPLAVHLGRHGVVPFGTAIEIHQGAEIGRPSVLHARAHGPNTALQRRIADCQALPDVLTQLLLGDDPLALRGDAGFCLLIGPEDGVHQAGWQLRGMLGQPRDGARRVLIDREPQAKPEFGVVLEQ